MASRTRPIVSRRERPAKPALTREGIVAAAVGVMRAEGLDKVTMRRLAQELDTGAASLYVYVRNTAELHAAMLEQLLGQVDLSPVAGAGDWRDRLIKILKSYTIILFRQPGLAQSVLVTRPSGPAYLSLAEAILELLSVGDVPPARAAWAVDILLHFATSTAADQRDHPDPPADGTRTARESADARCEARTNRRVTKGRRSQCRQEQLQSGRVTFLVVAVPSPRETRLAEGSPISPGSKTAQARTPSSS